MNTFDTKQIWAQVCAKLELTLSPASYNTWIITNPLTDIKIIDDSTVVGTITSPSAFHSTNVKKNFDGTLRDTISQVVQKTVSLEYQVGEPTVAAHYPPSSPSPFSTPQNQFQPFTQPMPQQNYQQIMPQPNQSPYQHYQASRSAPQSPRAEDLFSPSTIAANTLNQAEVVARQAGLRIDYSFENFAVSSSNEMAHAAATAVSQRPGQAYNPLFLYGDVGVGKTHLMQAIGYNIIKNNPSTKVLYVTSEDFTTEIVAAIQNKKSSRFKDKYRSVDVLLIDDIQFIAGKDTVQEEFFHTFNTLAKQNRQIVMTSDRPPHEIQLLKDRLRSRFEAGLMIDIQRPSFELRTAILLIKSKARNITIPMEFAQTIASKVESARQIEGIITRIVSEVELKKRTISQKLIDDILSKEESSPSLKLKIKPAEVIRTVANHYHIKQQVVKGQKRTKEVVIARHIAMYLLYNDIGLAYAETGRWFSNRDHASVIHACKKMDELLTHDSIMQQDVSAIRMSLRAISK